MPGLVSKRLACAPNSTRSGSVFVPLCVGMGLPGSSASPISSRPVTSVLPGRGPIRPSDL
eukprot:1710195-Alexandrium_andersonii.AAC.1